MSTINMRQQTRQLVKTMSDSQQTIMQTPSGNDTFMNRIPKFSIQQYMAALGYSDTNTGAHYAFYSRNDEVKDNLLVSTYAVNDTIGEYVSKPLERANGTWLNLLNQDCLKKGGHWHVLSIHEYAALKYHHFKLTGKAYTGSNFAYPILSGKTVLEANTGYSDVELNIGNIYNGIHVHEFPQLPVAGARVVNGILQVKEAGASDKIPELWNTEKTNWLWFNCATNSFAKVSDGIDQTKALFLSDATTSPKNYQMSSAFKSVGTSAIPQSAIDQLKILQLYPNRLNPYLTKLGTYSDSGTYYPIFKHDCKEIMFWGNEAWGGDANTGSLLCTFE